MENKFLFELGTEEIPASMIEPAMKQLGSALEELLRENEVGWTSLRTWSTPRRLTVIVEGLPGRCPDRDEVVSGPPRSVAFDSDGNPTPAAEGFAKKFGVPLGRLEVVDTGRGEYLCLRRRIEGEDVPAILRTGLSRIVKSLSWPKNMYWRESRFRFIRPLRWFVSLWNDQIVPFQFEGVESGRLSRGHRFLGDHRVTITSADSYADSLRREHVLVDPAERRDRIVEGLRAETAGYRLVADEALLQTVVHLNEFPTVVRGEFEKAYLEIPREILVTVMRHHQKYFSVCDDRGNLVPLFLTVLNTDTDPNGTIRTGHERVLRARLEDASFFWKADRKTSLEEKSSLLEHVLFQEKLGTYRDKTERLRRLCEELKENSQLDTAARLCKVDLTTEMVREFPELQGVMGGLYARQEGYPEAVWRAIYEHYNPISFEDPVPETETGTILSIADRIDTIVGCFGISIVPTGSSDRFALRRQAQGLVSILEKHQLRFALEELIGLAEKNFCPERTEQDTRRQVLRFLEQRVRHLLEKEGIPYDILNATFAVGIGTVPDARERAKALQEIKGEDDFEALATAFKRIKNILAKYPGDIKSVDSGALVEQEEKDLFQAYCRLQPMIKVHVAEGNFLLALRQMAGVRGIVDRFFDKVLVMTQDQGLRDNRLALLSEISRLFLLVADLSEIVQEGEQNG